MELDLVIAHLLQAEMLEGEAQRLWDDANSNLAYGRLSTEMRQRYVNQTYEATRKHASAMIKLRQAVIDLHAYQDAQRAMLRLARTAKHLLSGTGDGMVDLEERYNALAAALNDSDMPSLAETRHEAARRISSAS